MTEYFFDESRRFYQVSLKDLTLEGVFRFITFIRSVKQTQANFLVIYFEKDLLPTTEPTTVRDRLDWSKAGQLLTNLLESLPIPVVSIVNGNCTKEYLEIALSGDAIWLSSKATLDFSYGDGEDFTRFGSLKRFQTLLGNGQSSLLENDGGMKIAWKALLSSRNNQTFESVEDLERLIDGYAESVSNRSVLARRLLAYQNAVLPTNRSPYDYLEATIYANTLFLNRLGEIKHITDKQFRAFIGYHSGTNELVSGLDDIGNDYMDFKYYPDKELALLKRKSRIDEVKILLNQTVAPIRGRCIELGSGYGYFSALASKSPSVSESIALDISAAEMYQLGPFMWEYLQPDWSKFSLRIADMNKLDSEYGSFDTVIFCASLHHSGDIPQSLKIATNLLKPGGSLIIHGEHYDPIFLRPKKRAKEDSTPHTIRDFSRLLRQTNLEPKVFRYALPGYRFPRIKKLLLSTKPFFYLNGWVRFHSFMMLAVKK